MSPRTYSVSEVAAVAGVAPSTIRSWEARYGFPASSRTPGRHRRYTDTEVEQVRGLVEEMRRGRPVRKAIEALRARTEADPAADAEVREVLRGAMRVDPARVQRTLDGSSLGAGVEATIESVLLPALREIGRWVETGAASVANERAASDGVQRWLAKLHALSPPPFRDKTILFATAPDELHTLGLECLALLMARRGWAAVQLGAMTPADVLAGGAEQAGADAVVLSSHRAATRRSAIEAARSVVRFSRVPVFYGGDGFLDPAARVPMPGRYLADTIPAAVGALEAALAS
ncbi:MAG TPA: MerR family transcriptional regulator [Actinomycetota bacterium]|nr:MerR family transcriptional regulator [Actinomycetota bacterium]